MECCHLCWASLEGKKTLCTDCVRNNQETCKNAILQRKARLRDVREEGNQLKEKIKIHLEKNKDHLQRISDENLSAGKWQSIWYTWEAANEAFEKKKLEVEQLRTRIAERRNELAKAKKILDDVQRKTETQKKSAKPTVPSSNRVYEELQVVKHKLVHTRRTLITELLSFFPINPSPTASETETIIMNVTMPNHGMYSNYRPDALSAALGYVAHVVYIVASYLGITLPWRIEFAGARSSVWDPFEDKRHPLYGDRYADIEPALTLLNRDIVYMCGIQGVHVLRSEQRATLPNLLALLRSPTLGSPGPIDLQKPATPTSIRPPLKITGLTALTFQTATAEDNDEEDFIVLETPMIPTPEQHEDLEQFERAMFIDTV